MRVALQGLPARDCGHFGYAYELLGPPPSAAGQPDEAKRNSWIGECTQIFVPADYRLCFARWKASLSGPGSKWSEVRAKTRLLVGQGNPSGSEVGLTVHHTWGVPMIPGSALKGLLAHYVDAAYGGPSGEQRRWQGPTWRERRVLAGDGAGDFYAILFGAPDEEGTPHSAQRGFVEFHDALYVPDPHRHDEKPFRRDVLTPHQREYYRDPAKNWPCDWDDPNPVPFITVGPGVRFLLALGGTDAEWTDLAMKLLLEALKTWGVGAKTSAGYGRLES